MSFVLQPPELIVEQLRRLPLQDLLNACRVNERISEICQGRDLWALKLRDDFKVRNLSVIQNTREYYFNLFQKRRDILTFITDLMSEKTFNGHIQEFSRFFDTNTYQDFINLQKKGIDTLTEERIRDVEGIMRLIGNDEIFLFSVPNLGGDPDVPRTFFFDQYGNVVLQY